MILSFNPSFVDEASFFEVNEASIILAWSGILIPINPFSSAKFDIEHHGKASL
jgi:hypothetical protein